jgi:hypothetical protein
MPRSFVVIVFVFVCLVLTAPSIPAQEIKSPSASNIPFVRAGFFYGRTGTSQGLAGYLEINPVRWVGLCVFASYSQGTSERDGGTAKAWDFLTGGCVAAHLPDVKGFLISPFVQATYEKEHDRFTMPLGDGALYQYGADHVRHLLTPGVSVDRAIVKNGPRWAVRIGKNYGSGPAAKNGKGLYLVGGVIFPLGHPAGLGRPFRRMFGGKDHAAH